MRPLTQRLGSIWHRELSTPPTEKTSEQWGRTILGVRGPYQEELLDPAWVTLHLLFPSAFPVWPHQGKTVHLWTVLGLGPVDGLSCVPRDVGSPDHQGL